MSGHYPFSGKANRVSVFAFFEKHQLSLALQERYYRWWHEWASAFVQKDPDLSVTKGVEFSHFPYGQHAHGNFHLHDYRWATALIDLGQFIGTVILPKLDAHAAHDLEAKHSAFLHTLELERAGSPRAAPPDIGRYRHV